MKRKRGFPNIPFYATEAYKAAILDVVFDAIDRDDLPLIEVRITYEVQVNIWKAVGLSHVLDPKRPSHLTEEAERIKNRLLELVVPVIARFTSMMDKDKRPMPRKYIFIPKTDYCTNALAQGLHDA